MTLLGDSLASHEPKMQRCPIRERKPDVCNAWGFYTKSDANGMLANLT